MKFRWSHNHKKNLETPARLKSCGNEFNYEWSNLRPWEKPFPWLDIRSELIVQMHILLFTFSCMEFFVNFQSLLAKVLAFIKGIADRHTTIEILITSVFGLISVPISISSFISLTLNIPLSQSTIRPNTLLSLYSKNEGILLVVYFFPLNAARRQ